MEKQYLEAIKPGAHTLARGLGCLSLLLGFVQIMRAPEMARRTGFKSTAMIRLGGLREVLNGAGLLLAEDPRPWMQARVAGDALDLTSLAGGLGQAENSTGRVLLSLVAVAGITAADVAVVQALGREQRRRQARQYHYEDRSGLPRPAERMRGAAHDAVLPDDRQAVSRMAGNLY